MGAGGARSGIGDLRERLTGGAGALAEMQVRPQRGSATAVVAQVSELVQYRAVLGKHQQQRQDPRKRQTTHLFTTGPA